MNDGDSDLTQRLSGTLALIAHLAEPRREAQLADLRLRMIRHLAAAAAAGQWDGVAAIQQQIEGTKTGVRLGFQRQHDGRHYTGMACLEDRDGERQYFWLVIRDDGMEARVRDDSLTLTDREIVLRALDAYDGRPPKRRRS